MQLLLEGHDIVGFMDGSTPCPAEFLNTNSGDSEVNSKGFYIRSESDDFKIWKMHDKALMQLIATTLSLAALSCLIRNTNSQDMWN